MYFLTLHRAASVMLASTYYTINVCRNAYIDSATVYTILLALFYRPFVYPSTVTAVFMKR